VDLRSQLQANLGTSFAIERELGGGGMSRVFVAREVRLSRKVVIKVLNPELVEGLNAQRFEREILLAASLQQANIVPVLSAGDVEGLPYFTMPFVEGESLRTRLISLAAVEKRLGELYDSRHERQKAIEHYAAFVDQWKEADAELQPVVATVRRRLNELRGQEGP
jgi:serine/threonine protein kinase